MRRSTARLLGAFSGYWGCVLSLFVPLYRACQSHCLSAVTVQYVEYFSRSTWLILVAGHNVFCMVDRLLQSALATRSSRNRAECGCECSAWLFVQWVQFSAWQGSMPACSIHTHMHVVAQLYSIQLIRHGTCYKPWLYAPLACISLAIIGQRRTWVLGLRINERDICVPCMAPNLCALNNPQNTHMPKMTPAALQIVHLSTFILTQGRAVATRLISL